MAGNELPLNCKFSLISFSSELKGGGRLSQLLSFSLLGVLQEQIIKLY